MFTQEILTSNKIKNASAKFHPHLWFEFLLKYKRKLPQDVKCLKMMMMQTKYFLIDNNKNPA